jgi:hypothetical protein
MQFFHTQCIQSRKATGLIRCRIFSSSSFLGGQRYSPPKHLVTLRQITPSPVGEGNRRSSCGRCACSVLLRHMGGATGTHLLRRRRSSPRGLPLPRLRRFYRRRRRGCLLGLRRLGSPLLQRLRPEQLLRRRCRPFLFLPHGVAAAA